MKKISIVFTAILLLQNCSKNDRVNNCNFLFDAAVNATVNLNLPQFSQLQFISNSVYIPNQGNAGIIVTNVGTGLRAWDAADPNHAPTSCSLLSITGSEATCGCQDANTYSLFTGAPLENGNLACGLKEYRVSPSGSNTFLITN
ncbi:hypothetical protein RM697_06185 [Ichthyenterobacterium sp. W332]|uniref:Ferredoxin subunit of nitrite reductase or a ring-hydroxylating dioxygenase n=1 Tax=Microcosmobacter mediterraneus TaxID=3075607 RepID=A0ABU2YKK9_9FLAO|nr:hypothetical protein [Ichthyenterobacterium sp. W332]MDT0558224.1 hypothetical protein [Ichthyenterobacterium sp. W332]